MTEGIAQQMAATAGLAFLSVALWTVRVAFTSRGRKLLGSGVAAIEATVFAVAFSRLLSGIDSPHQVIAYGAGVAAGTMVGLLIDDVVNPQLVRVDAVVSRLSGDVVDALHGHGYPTTVSEGHGISGEVKMVSVTLSEDRTPRLFEILDETAPEAFWTVSPVSTVRPSPLPLGFCAVTDLARRRRSRSVTQAAGLGDRHDRRPVGGLVRCPDLQ